MTTATAAHTEAVATLAELDDAQLFEMARTLEARPTLDSAERCTLAWIRTAVEVRHPEITAAMDAWALSDSPLNYTDALAAAIDGATW